MKKDLDKIEGLLSQLDYDELVTLLEALEEELNKRVVDEDEDSIN